MRARSDLNTAACLPSIADDRHRAAASDFAIRQGEPSVIMMNIPRQNCTHHGVRRMAKQAFEFRRSGRCHLRAEANAGSIQEPMFISLTDVDWNTLAFQTKRQGLFRVTRNAAPDREVVSCTQWNDS